MTHRSDVARGRDIVERWCTLAEQRLRHLTELFDTGRWRRYHSERAFLENIQEAKAAVELWRDLLTREVSRDHSAIDLSWLGRTRSALPRVGVMPDQPQRLQLKPVPTALPPGASISLTTVHLPPEEAPSAPDPGAAAPEMPPALTPDIAAMHERYPLLRNAL